MKYMGSKAKHAKDMLPIILKDRKIDQWYVEPFIGGANMIKNVTGNRIGADSNEYLIALYQYTQTSDVMPLISMNSDKYKHIRDNKKLYPSWYVGLIGFCYSYAAKFFGGFIANSKDIVCAGRDRMGESYRASLKIKKEVDGVHLVCCSYNELHIPDNSIIYCDPPYRDTTKYKDSFNHEIFYDWVRNTVNAGHNVFISEYWMPDDFICVWEKEVNSSLTKDTGSKKATERLFVHKSQLNKIAES